MKFKLKWSPKPGDIRVFVKFAWWPVTVMGPGGFYHIWLRKYRQVVGVRLFGAKVLYNEI